MDDKIKLMKEIGKLVCTDCDVIDCGDEPEECAFIAQAMLLHDQYLVKMCEEDEDETS